jgi:hypothetical protein
MKICVLGNSHVGSLKRGWDLIRSEFRGQEITFFAHRAGGLIGLMPHQGKLVPNNEELAKALAFTSGGKREIDPKEYDVFLIYGAITNASFIQDSQHYSRAVRERTLSDLVANSLAFILLKRLRTLTDKAIFIGHMPLLAATEILFKTTPSDYLANLKLANEVSYRPLNAELVTQPLSTIVNGANTHPAFSKGSKRLAIGDRYDDEAHPETDTDHMNDRFGEIWLREFLTKYLSVPVAPEAMLSNER